jgi:hypothetical protein
VFFAVDLLLWHHAIAAAGAGIATVLGNLQVVFVGFGAWAAFGRAAVAAAGDGAAGGDGRRGDDLRGDRQRRVRV